MTHLHSNPSPVIGAALALSMLAAPAQARPDVTESWVERHDGPAGMNDYGEAIALGDDGSVYVAGFVFEEVGGGSFAPRFATIRYDATGAMQWIRSYAGTFASGAAAARHIALDPSGHVLVAGSTNHGDDWAVVKYDADGNELWRTVYAAGSTYLTEPDDMAVDADGNVYLVGDVGDPINPDFGALVRIDADGTLAWIRKYYGPTFDGGLFGAVSVDDLGNVYASGAAVVPGSASDLCVAKYAPDGTQLWVALDGAFNPLAHDSAVATAIDADGNLVAAGRYGGNTTDGIDIAVLAFDPDGTRLWRTFYDGPEGRNDFAADLVLDMDGAILVAGQSYRTFDDSDALLLKYGAAGTLQWEARIAGDDVHADHATAVDVDGAGNVYITGSYDPIGGARYFTARFDPTGVRRWLTEYAGPMGEGSTAWAIAVDDTGTVAVTGDSPGIGTAFDIATIRYEQPGAAPGDIDGDGVVGVTDLLQLLERWGACDDCMSCPADLDDDCTVGTSDLLIVLANWS